MRHRNPIFVAAFPYFLVLIGYVFMFTTLPSGEQISPVQGIGMLAAFALMLVGVGYSLYWLISTAREMRKNYGAEIPTAWLLIIPFVNIWWMWKYCQGVDKVTEGKISAPLGLVLIIAVGTIGYAIFQDYFNKLPERAEAHEPRHEEPEKPASHDPSTGEPPEDPVK
jgi:EamA domain-containing membrane protein RarD